MAADAPVPIQQYDLLGAQARAARLANDQSVYQQGQQQNQQDAAPGVLMALAQMNQQQPQTPMPGQPSQPMTGPNAGATPVQTQPMPPMRNAGQPDGYNMGQNASMGNFPSQPTDPSQGPNLTRIDPSSAQPQQSPYSQNGYSIQQMLSAINQAMPNASPQVKLAALTQAQGVLNNDAKQQLAMLKAAYMPQQMADRNLNAQSAAERGDAAVNNSNMNFATKFDPNNTAPPINYLPAPQMGGGSPAPAQPMQPTQAGQTLPPVPAWAAPTLQNATAGSPGGGAPSSTRGSAAQGKASLSEAQSAARITGATNEARAAAMSVLNSPNAKTAMAYLPQSGSMLTQVPKNVLAAGKGDPGFNTFKSNNIAVSGELVRALTQGRGDQKLQQKIQDQLDNAPNQSAYKAVVNSYISSTGATATAAQRVVGQAGRTAGGEQGQPASDDGWGKMQVQ